MTAMLLLPPSESKASGTTSARLSLEQLTFPQLAPQRAAVLDSLINLCSTGGKKAQTTLGLTVGLLGEIERNAGLARARTSPAREVYTGVLYEAVGFESLSQRALKRLDVSAYTMSALFGLVGMADLIPAYRLSAGTVLPRVGSLRDVWKQPVGEILGERGDLIIDLRSSAYATMAPLPRTVNAVVPRILQKMPSGPPRVVSHHNKAWKGRIVRGFATAPKPANTVEALVEVISGLGAEVRVVPGGAHTRLDVIVGTL